MDLEVSNHPERDGLVLTAIRGYTLTRKVWLIT